MEEYKSEIRIVIMDHKTVYGTFTMTKECSEAVRNGALVNVEFSYDPEFGDMPHFCLKVDIGEDDV